MTQPLPRTATTFSPPVPESRRWIDGVTFPPERPLLNVSQAAPVDLPPLALREVIAEAALNDPQAHLYGPVLGMPALREELAASIMRRYGGAVSAGQIAITSGCNEAFCAVTSTLLGEGDEALLPTPWYFNHKMWLDMIGAKTVPLKTGDDLLPDPELARALITDRTRVIVLVSPNNPSGVEYPAELIAAFRDLAREKGLALIVDETYRDFHSLPGAPHDLFTDPDWDDTLIHLYSFSKSYRLTGHRVGAVATSVARLAEIEKYLDTVTICPAQLGQIAALWGLRNLDQWVAGEREEILARRRAVEEARPVLESGGWSVLGCGAYFAYMAHSSDTPSDELAPRLVREAGVLMLPGTMFMPTDDLSGKRQMRVAFANVDRDGIAELARRLAAHGG
ncbi:aminotransferase [Pseudooceanicola nanhaiensis]|uniref:aminotransferase n=1 Tax=Pseudooceanicola nanhaiensis TaxID=375761 RepID=UPI001CD69D41|nr:aminotransferase [Pseudooceanicola nanhaiensis]MCA0919998.1 aminotransferase [Pseudooceanicola nanhaiensis]